MARHSRTNVLALIEQLRQDHIKHLRGLRDMNVSCQESRRKLAETLDELEKVRAEIYKEFGDQIYMARLSDGSYVAAEVLGALAVGYAALTQKT